jgi:phosphomannomutase
MILHRMAMTVEPISAIYDGLPQFEIVKDRIELAGIDIDSILKKAKTTFSDAAVNEIDGIKFSWNDRWIHLRSSNTEPIMRIYAEGPTKAEAQGLINQIRSKL